MQSFPAAVVTRLANLAGGRTYRVVVATSPHYTGATSAPVTL